MDFYGKESTRRLRRNSKTLQDIIHKGIHEAGRDSLTYAKSGRDSKMIHSVASLIQAKSKLLLLESPDTVEIYKLDDPPPRTRPAKDGAYLPAIATKASSLTSLRGLGLGTLSQSCPYLYDKRRGSFSSVASQRTGNQNGKQSTLKTRREAKKSNVTVSMTYLGQGRRGSVVEPAQDELKVLQQVNGGENICVFKGMVTPGEQFQFISQRHRGYPFSATFYVNGLMVARISSCCEYRYSPGFRQGKKSCFRLAWLAGGVPCYRCTSLRNKYSSCQQLSNSTKENILPPEQSLGRVTKAGNEGPIFPTLPKAHSPAVSGVESCPSSPLFIPAKPEKKAVRRTRKQDKNSGNASTDNDEQIVTESNKVSEKKKRRKGHSNQKGSKSNGAVANKREDKKPNSEGSDISPGAMVMDHVVSHGQETKQQKEPEKQKTSSDIQQTHTIQATSAQPHQSPHSVLPQPSTQQPQNKSSQIQISSQAEGPTKLKAEQREEHRSNEKPSSGERQRDFYEECVEMSLSKHNWFKASILERCRLQKKLSSGPKSPGSDLELSAESESIQPEEEPEEEEEEPVPEQDLEAQVEAMITVLKTSDAVEQLVLRNTDLTDDLLLSLAGALKSSPSAVTLLNLNLNCIGPYGAHILLEVMRVKTEIKALHLFGNRFRDHGLLALLNGIVDLQEQTAMAAAAIHQAMLSAPEQEAFLQQTMGSTPCDWASFKVFVLVELDIGGNGLGSEGVKLLASYIRLHSYLQYLGLAQTSGADLAAWKELFESLKENMSLSQIILDENNLGDPGVRLLAEVLTVNMNLQQVDLDGNNISDVGGNDLMGALLCRTQYPLRHLSLQDNYISSGLMSRIQEQVSCP